MRYIIGTPEGTRDRLPGECAERRAAEARLTALFRRRGFGEVITPAVEFYDLFLLSGNPLPQEDMLKSIDRDGRILVMRPDCTAPVARVASTGLAALPLPQRLYYCQTVFRSGAAGRGGRSEIAQCGVELIGAAGERADAETIALAVDALRVCGLKSFHIELGHGGFFRALAAELSIAPAEAERMRACIESKNFAALNDLLEPYAEKPAGRALRRLSRLFGGAEALDEARALAAGTAGMESVEYLAGLFRVLEAAGYGAFIRFDLGLVNHIDYYTGLVFRGYAEGAGGEVLSGGRYDALTAAFGRSAPATGFAVDVDEVSACLAPEAPSLRLLIHFAPERLRRALECLDEMPPGTAALSPCETREESLAFARARGAEELLVLDEAGEERARV